MNFPYITIDTWQFTGKLNILIAKELKIKPNSKGFTEYSTQNFRPKQPCKTYVLMSEQDVYILPAFANGGNTKMQ